MSLTGNLRTMPVPELFEWLAASRKTGTLVLDGPRYSKKLFFISGDLVAVASENPREKLGNYLVGWGYLTQEELDHLVEMQAHFKIMLGELAVKLGQVSQEERDYAIRVKTEEAICELLLWDEGDFRFLDGVLPERDFAELRLPVHSILLEGVRQRDERQRIAKVVTSTKQRPRLVREPPAEELGPIGSAILRAVDGERSIEEIVLRCRVTEFSVLRFIHRGVKEGWFELAAPVPSGEEVVPDSAWRKLAFEIENRIEVGHLLEAVELLTDLQRKYETDTSVSSYASERQAEIERCLEQWDIPDEAVLEPAIKMEEIMKLGCGPVEGFAFSRVNGRYTVSEILRLLPGGDLYSRAVIHNLIRRGFVKPSEVRSVRPAQGPYPGSSGGDGA
ncbi:MAG: DUF4388 domain-containing protein [Acidobacteria bacterium]|nr:DUF4388 domain-containing protein [Acidobacteriota bacterium]